MESNSEEIQELRSRLDVLIQKYVTLNSDVNELRLEMRELRTRIDNLAEADGSVKVTPSSEKIETPKAPVVEVNVPEVTSEKVAPIIQAVPEPIVPEVERPILVTPSEPKEKSTIESFLGENLANKIGIAIILIGIGVGVKYAIDKNILGPAMRIALGYLAGAILVGFAIYLKKKYENLSAVMFAGGLAVAYFVTFIAFDFYHLFPKMVAFGTMVVLTVVTSLGALRYDKQVIAIVGLVGAYAVPFLLSDGTGTTSALFIYMTILNAGILFLAFRKNWQPVFAVAFGCTWFIFFILTVRAALELHSDYETLLVFGSIFYVLFYVMIIANKMRHKQNLPNDGSTVVILNSIFGFAFGIILVNEIYDDSNINGIYTLIFAASQGVVTFITSRQKEADHRLYYLSFGFALIYATVSVPMLFDGNWITMIWSLQAALFFWIGWKKDDGFFERITYIPLALAVFSLIDTWFDMSRAVHNYPISENIPAVLNEYFLSGLILAGAIFFMAYIKHTSKKTSTLTAKGGLFTLLSDSIVYLGVIILYFTAIKEIDIFWEQKANEVNMESGYYSSFFSITDNFKTIWILIFSLIFTGALQLVNRYLYKNKVLATTIGITSAAAILAFLAIGLYNISLLRDRALEGVYGDQLADYSLVFNIRYIGFCALAFILWANWHSLRTFFTERIFKQGIEIFIHVCLVWVVCAELIHLKKMNGGGDLYRAGLTIFGGIYSFGLIAYGIWKKKPHLRLLALVLFGVTLLKLFIYDIAKVDSGGKTIAFISLGVLLLVISFLYTKYKHLILPGGDGENEVDSSE